MAGDQIIDRLSAPAIRHMFELDAGKLCEPLGHHLLLRTDAGRGEAQAGPLLREAYEFRQRTDAERWMNGKRHRLARYLDDRYQVFQRVDTQLENMRCAGDEIRSNEDRIAIRSAFGAGFDTDNAGRARLVLDVDLLAEGARQIVGDRPRCDVGRAAGRV